MNRILATRPRLTPTTLVFGPPPWLIRCFRSILFVAGCITAFVAVQHWSAMPLFARFLGALIAPSLIGWSGWSRPWRYTTKFIANESGIYFPSYPSLTFPVGSTQIEESWLEVPWRHIANVRVAKEVGEDGTCVAFDVQVSLNERTVFFEALGVPRDRGEQLPGTVSAAFGGWPPSSAQVVQSLRSLNSHLGP